MKPQPWPDNEKYYIKHRDLRRNVNHEIEEMALKCANVSTVNINTIQPCDWSMFTSTGLSAKGYTEMWSYLDDYLQSHKTQFFTARLDTPAQTANYKRGPPVFNRRQSKFHQGKNKYQVITCAHLLGNT